LPDRWAEFHEFRTRDCARAAHRDCAHFVGVGGGLNPRRLRLEFGASLCACSCHSSCPVAITTKRFTVPPKEWYASCTCPGAGQARQRFDEAGGVPDFGELREQAERRSQARKEAYEAARVRAAGKSRAEIRDIYVAELSARGLRVPTERLLDAVVERIAGNPLPAARVLGESLVQMGKGIYELSRLFRQRH
jgi:hypothetical protein